jgi:hypothetical protein
LTSRAAEPVFSGPQKGERISRFKVAPLNNDSAAAERDPVAENGGKPIALVFLHALERSLVPLLRVVDTYGEQRKDHLRTEVIFLSGDRISGEQKMKAAQNSLRMKSNLGLSLDGAEGPGNYGLNKECMLTIVIANGDRVTDNFALVQPGIADAPRVLAALAKASGDDNPPAAESLLPARAAEAMRAGARRANAEMRNAEGKDPFPGAVPTDERLQGLLRRFIRPNNDDATVDQLLTEIKAYIKDDASLRKQARDGWTRMLHFGDRYGTPYSRKVGAEFLETLKKDAPPETETKS